MTIAMIPLPPAVRGVDCDRHRHASRHETLAVLVQETFKRDPHGGDLYVFRGKSSKLIKILWHDGLRLRRMAS
jgi:transposase